MLFLSPASALHVRGENPWGYPDHWYRNVHASRAYGGSGGSPFSDRSYEQARIVTISVWSGNPDYIHAIQVTYGRRTAAKHGGNGGTRHDFEVRVNQGEKITEVRLRVGWHVDRIGFKTNHGRDLGAVGGMGGKYHVVRPPFIEGWTLGCYLVSIEGRAGAIQVTYGRYTADKHGGNGGTRHDFDLRDEQITEIRIRAGRHVDRIGFKTDHGRDLGEKRSVGDSGVNLPQRPLIRKCGAPAGLDFFGIFSEGGGGNYLGKAGADWTVKGAPTADDSIPLSHPANTLKDCSGRTMRVSVLMTMGLVALLGTGRFFAAGDNSDGPSALEEELEHLLEELDGPSTLKEELDGSSTLEEELDRSSTLEEELDGSSTLEEELDGSSTLEEELDQVLEELAVVQKELESKVGDNSAGPNTLEDELGYDAIVQRELELKASALHVGRQVNKWGYPDSWFKNVHASQPYGGYGGEPFSDRSYEQDRIVTISVWTGNPDYIHA
uniref:Jacalin-type lectin domain-containing protein n=1 Tax=Branchiostoma floridae TaxID=7739 RepID=C3ZSA4_BRAFL|eukprot:XP_002588578.1 hypothetical protein BRAFLDRAFT_110732 [Branchiostoma floridae]